MWPAAGFTMPPPCVQAGASSRTSESCSSGLRDGVQSGVLRNESRLPRTTCPDPWAVPEVNPAAGWLSPQASRQPGEPAFWWSRFNRKPVTLVHWPRARH
ncbi:unnamed protein product [Arctogadus glacialis]